MLCWRFPALYNIRSHLPFLRRLHCAVYCRQVDCCRIMLVNIRTVSLSLCNTIETVTISRGMFLYICYSRYIECIGAYIKTPQRRMLYGSLITALRCTAVPDVQLPTLGTWLLHSWFCSCHRLTDSRVCTWCVPVYLSFFSIDLRVLVCVFVCVFYSCLCPLHVCHGLSTRNKPDDDDDDLPLCKSYSWLSTRKTNKAHLSAGRTFYNKIDGLILEIHQINTTKRKYKSCCIFYQ